MNRFCLLAIALLVCVQLTMAQVPKTLPQQVIDYMGSRDQRYYHLFFHSTRLNYYRLGPNQQHAMRNLGWEPPRPASAYTADGTEVVLPGNNNGEDFLYMHRKMIEDVNRITAELNSPYGKVTGWLTVPAPGDKNWPVPEAYTIAGQVPTTEMIAMFKTPDFYWDQIKPREEALSEATFLRTMTLGELGALLENEIHFFLHNRFSAANPVGYRIQNPMTPVDAVDAKWDDLRYNWLGDFYSAHVSATFWMIHGWVETRIEMWRVANSLEKIIWVGTWEGGPSAAFAELAKVSQVGEAGPYGVGNAADSSDSSSLSDIEIDQGAVSAILKLLLAAKK